MVKLISSREFSYGILIFFAFAFIKISHLSKENTVSLPGGKRLKSEFLVVCLELPTFIYKPATEDCQSNSTVLESCGSLTSKNSLILSLVETSTFPVIVSST